MTKINNISLFDIDIANNDVNCRTVMPKAESVRKS
jgi:hypothetical protein